MGSKQAQENKNYARVFALFALTIPFLFFFFLEVGLRFSSAWKAHQVVFMSTGPQESFWVINPAYPDRFFTGFRPGVAFHPFRKEKDRNSFRIVVFGGSSSAGYPYQFGYAFPEYLSLILQKSRPDLEIEVINLGMTAVNSYTVWDLVRRLPQIEPDAVVFYMGHNEYYGALGVGSAHSGWLESPFLKRLGIRLDESAIIFHLRHWFREKPTGEPVRTTTMERVVQNAQIYKDSEDYHAGIRQFSDNVKKINALLEPLGIPVFWGTVASNLKDQAPLGDATEANRNFEMGLEAWKSGNIELAIHHFKEAREHDEIRFRAPSAINEIIRSQAAAPNSYLIDFDSLSYKLSVSGIPDNSLFTDHLHPDFEGYKALATLAADQIARTFEFEIDPDLPRYFIDPFDESLAETNIILLKSGFPFNKNPQRDYPQFLRETIRERTNSGNPADQAVGSYLAEGRPLVMHYDELVRQTQNSKNLEVRERLLLYQGLLHWQPFNRRLHNEAVSLLLENEIPFEYAEAILLQSVRRFRDPQHVNLLGALYLAHDQPETAFRFLKVAEKYIPDNPALLLNLSRYYIISGDTTQARSYYRKAAELTR